MRRFRALALTLAAPLAACAAPGAAPTGGGAAGRLPAPPPVVKAVALPGHAVTVRWRADRAAAAFADLAAAPEAPAARVSLLTSAVEAATNCAVAAAEPADGARRIETRLDCSRRPLLSL